MAIYGDEKCLKTKTKIIIFFVEISRVLKLRLSWKKSIHIIGGSQKGNPKRSFFPVHFPNKTEHVFTKYCMRPPIFSLISDGKLKNSEN